MRDLPTIGMAHGMSNEWVDRAGLRIMCGVVMDPGPVGDMLRAPDSRSGREWTAGRVFGQPLKSCFGLLVLFFCALSFVLPVDLVLCPVPGAEWGRF